MLRTSYEQAYWLLDSGVSEARFDSEYLGLMGTAALGAAYFDEAQVIYERLVGLVPLEPRFWAGLAEAQSRSGDDAGPSYRRVLSLAPEGSVLYEHAVARERAARAEPAPEPGGALQAAPADAA